MSFFRKIFRKGDNRPAATNLEIANSMPSQWRRPTCDCLAPQYEGQPSWAELPLHEEVQDTTCEAWGWLLEAIEKARRDRIKSFSPRAELGWDRWQQIVTLPPSIGQLTSVRELELYSSHLVRLPPEIGGMTELREFTPYTSYRLHWFPYELTRCAKLERSCVSTRALYGNYKYRPPFPKLPPNPSAPAELPLDSSEELASSVAPDFARWHCSVCDGLFPARFSHTVWISLRVATDVLPLLVHACSEACLRNLPASPDGYVDGPHKGGLELSQPATLH